MGIAETGKVGHGHYSGHFLAVLGAQSSTPGMASPAGHAVAISKSPWNVVARVLGKKTLGRGLLERRTRRNRPLFDYPMDSTSTSLQAEAARLLGSKIAGANKQLFSLFQSRNFHGFHKAAGKLS